jgi:hypothetical protein
MTGLIRILKDAPVEKSVIESLRARLAAAANRLPGFATSATRKRPRFASESGVGIGDFLRRVRSYAPRPLLRDFPDRTAFSGMPVGRRGV